MKKYILLISFLIFNFSLAQYPEYLTYGVKAGGSYSKISGLGNMLYPENYFQGYKVKEKELYGFVGGIFLNYKFPNSRLAIQPEILYSQQGGRLEYSDILELKHKTDFKYDYLTVLFLTKFYPFDENSTMGGLNIGAGLSLGMNLNPNDIKYKSNTEEFGEDLTTQQMLRDVLKGKTDFSILFNLGYEWENGLMVEARYGLGLKDIIETQANGLNFIENSNKSSVISLSLGYSFSFDARNSY